MKKFVALARVSSREQEREGFSLAVQEDALRAYAKKVGGEIVRLFRIAETASKFEERKTFRELVAFALGACIGDIQRFSQPKKLVKYAGLDPAFDDSGEATWRGGIGGHGHKPLRALLMESAQSILRSPNHPLARWAKKLLARKGAYNLVVAATARRLLVQVWYLMMGRAEPVEHIDPKLRVKLGKIVAKVSAPALKDLGKDRLGFRQDMEQSLRHGRVYSLDPRRAFVPSVSPSAKTAAVPVPRPSHESHP